MITFARGHMVLYLYNQWYELFMQTSLTGTVIAGKVATRAFPSPLVLTQSSCLSLLKSIGDATQPYAL